jgi:hypothetical protein
VLWSTLIENDREAIMVSLATMDRGEREKEKAKGKR